MSDKTGGSAFPVTPSEKFFVSSGMTLRDYFAAKAMQSLITNANSIEFSSRENLATAAYLCADALLTERDK